MTWMIRFPTSNLKHGIKRPLGSMMLGCCWHDHPGLDLAGSPHLMLLQDLSSDLQAVGFWVLEKWTAHICEASLGDDSSNPSYTMIWLKKTRLALPFPLTLFWVRSVHSILGMFCVFHLGAGYYGWVDGRRAVARTPQ